MHKVLIYAYAFLPNILPKCFIFYESLLELKIHTVFNTEIFRHSSKIENQASLFRVFHEIFDYQLTLRAFPNEKN